MIESNTTPNLPRPYANLRICGCDEGVCFPQSSDGCQYCHTFTVSHGLTRILSGLATSWATRTLWIPEEKRVSVGNICEYIREHIIHIIRHDTNFFTLPYWRNNEKPPKRRSEMASSIAGQRGFPVRRAYPLPCHLFYPDASNKPGCTP